MRGLKRWSGKSGKLVSALPVAAADYVAPPEPIHAGDVVMARVRREDGVLHWVPALVIRNQGFRIRVRVAGGREWGVASYEYRRVSDEMRARMDLSGLGL